MHADAQTRSPRACRGTSPCGPFLRLVMPAPCALTSFFGVVSVFYLVMVSLDSLFSKRISGYGVRLCLLCLLMHSRRGSALSFSAALYSLQRRYCSTMLSALCCRSIPHDLLACTAARGGPACRERRERTRRRRDQGPAGVVPMRLFSFRMSHAAALLRCMRSV